MSRDFHSKNWLTDLWINSQEKLLEEKDWGSASFLCFIHSLGSQPPTALKEVYFRWLLTRAWSQMGQGFCERKTPSSIFKASTGLVEEENRPHNLSATGIHPHFQFESVKSIVESVRHLPNCSDLLGTCFQIAHYPKAFPNGHSAQFLSSGSSRRSEDLGLRDQLTSRLVWRNLFNFVEPRAPQSFLTKMLLPVAPMDFPQRHTLGKALLGNE